jgi:hypothetical protein
MNKQLKPICAAVMTLCLALSCNLSYAEAEALADAADAAASASASASANASASRNHRIVINTDDFHFNSGEVDSLVSGKISEAFSRSFSSHNDKPVKNAPYSAEVVTENIQTLADGNQISIKTTSMSYRDSAGRTRHEVRDPKGELKVVHIVDPTDGTRYIVTPSNKSVNKISFDKDFAARIEATMAKAAAAREKATEQRVKAAEMREKAASARAAARGEERDKDGRNVTIERGPNGEEITIKRSARTRSDGKQEETVVKVVRMGDDHGPNDKDMQNHVNITVQNAVGQAMEGLSRLGPITSAAGDRAWRNKTTTTDLGSKDFDGVKATGKKISYTIPVGEVGNMNPITVSSETWYSPDLQVTVYSKHSDPRNGDVIYRLANLKRVDQPATLFGAPEGYKVRETKVPSMPMPPMPPMPPSTAMKPMAPMPPMPTNGPGKPEGKNE